MLLGAEQTGQVPSHILKDYSTLHVRTDLGRTHGDRSVSTYDIRICGRNVPVRR